jgi:anti-sigma factor RsiW
MNCEIAHERIVTAAYGELSDEQMHELDRHMAGCPDCHKEREALLALKVLADTHPVLEPNPNLIARSRQRLEEALDALPAKRWYERLGQRMVNNFASLQHAPLAACLLLLAGIGAGTLGGFEFAQGRAARMLTATQAAAQAHSQQPQSRLPVSASDVASISSIVRQPNSEIVQVRYNRLVPQQVEGSLDDPGIRQLLMLAMQDSVSAGVRDDSIGLMAAECRAGHSCKPEGIRDALMAALRYDRNSGVREKALEGLEPYVSEDLRVRDAVLEALLSDSDPQIRSEAINILEPVEADTSVRQVLTSVADSDQNPHIRTVSRQVLSRVPEIQ